MKRMLRIVKVGGSLFTLADLPQRLASWLASQPAAVNVLLAGGGELADAVRRWDQQFGLGHERSHEMCVELLDVSAQLLLSLLPEARWTDRWEEVCHEAGGVPGRHLLVFAPARFLRCDESDLPGTPLPHTWQTTSDSIAARLAEVTGADELVLLKSADPPTNESRTEQCSVLGSVLTVNSDYVDPWFTRAARGLPSVKFVNLRNNG